MSLRDASLAALELAINQYLSANPDNAARLARFHGRALLLDIVGPNIRLYLIPDASGQISLLGSYEGEPAASVRGTPLALFRAKGESGSTQLFGGAVEIGGDSDYVQQFSDAMSASHIDWEGLLAQLTGEVIAHDIGSLFRHGLHWGSRTADRLGQNLQEYLQEELKLLPNRFELEDFAEEVDALRDDIERIEARIARAARGRS